MRAITAWMLLRTTHGCGGSPADTPRRCGSPSPGRYRPGGEAAVAEPVPHVRRRGPTPKLGAVVFAHEIPGLTACFGIALVSAGIITLAFQGKKVRADFLPAAFTTGVLIGSYTVVDGIGVRLSGNSLAYANTMFLLWSVTTPAIFYAMRGRPPAYTAGQT